MRDNSGNRKKFRMANIESKRNRGSWRILPQEASYLKTHLHLVWMRFRWDSGLKADTGMTEDSWGSWDEVNVFCMWKGYEFWEAKEQSVMCWTVPLKNSYVVVRTPSASECDRLWKEGLYRCNEVKTQLWGLQSWHDWCACKKRQFGYRHVQREDNIKTEREDSHL